MNPLRLAQLQMFCAVVEEGSVVAASRRLNCVASNVTTRLRELEQLLGQELFLRDKGRLSLTPEGRLFYQQASPLVISAQGLTDFFSDASPKGVLVVAALDVALQGYLARRVPSFIAAYPGVELKLLLRPTYTVERMLTDGEIDLGLTDGPISHPMIGSLPAFQERLALVVPKGVTERGLTGLHVFLFNTDCFYRRYFETWLEGQGLSAPLIHTVESYDVILGCVRAGLGMSCFPQSIVEGLSAEQRQGVEVLYPEDLRGSEVCFIWREPGLSDLGRRFVQHIDEDTGS